MKQQMELMKIPLIVNFNVVIYTDPNKNQLPLLCKHVKLVFSAGCRLVANDFLCSVTGTGRHHVVSMSW